MFITMNASALHLILNVIALVQEFIDGSKDKFTPDKVLAFFPNEFAFT